MNKINFITTVTAVILATVLFAGCTAAVTAPAEELPPEGTCYAQVRLTGGSGRATVESPSKIVINSGTIYATIVWSSDNYDYMVVSGKKYLNESTEGNSSFTFPIPGFNDNIAVTADTTAMSTPHEIEYNLYFELIK